MASISPDPEIRESSLVLVVVLVLSIYWAAPRKEPIFLAIILFR